MNYTTEYLKSAYNYMIGDVDIEKIFRKADVKILLDISYGSENEISREWDIIIHDDQAYNEFTRGGLGFIESYIKGYWSCDDLAELFRKLEEANLYDTNLYTIPQLLYLGLNRIWIGIKGFNVKDGELVGLQHYDLPLELYETMLGPTMTYSCGYFKNDDNLDIAQTNKFDLIARKMHLKPGQKILDIGCGWGTLACYLAVQYDVEVVGITISKEQIKYCHEKYKNKALTFKLEDYRNLEGEEEFDRIISVGMFEHVVSCNYETYFEVCKRLLKPYGLMLLHTITGDKSHSPGDGNPFIMKYIFPNSQLPSLSQITEETAYKFVVEDIQNFGLYYAKTLKEWRSNFNTDEINKKLTEAGEDILTDSFIRMWEAYLIMSQVGFERNRIYLHQLVLSRGGDAVYEAVR